MNKNILVVGFACLSAVAVAQSDGTQQKSANPAPSSQQVTSPRDVATGQASGKRMHKPITVTTEDEALRESPSKASLGKTSQDQALRESPSKASLGKTSVRVAAGDVNGDGRADVAASGASSDVKSPRDLATGQASGKRAQQPASGNAQPGSDKSPAKPNR